MMLVSSTQLEESSMCVLLLNAPLARNLDWHEEAEIGTLFTSVL